MKKRICCLIILLLLVCGLSASAEIAEKSTAAPSSTPTTTTNRNVVVVTSGTAVPTTAPTAAPQATKAPSVVIINSNVSVNNQSTATPIPASMADGYVQDPVSFAEGSVSFYANEDNAYCNRRVYQVNGMTAQAFAEAYAEVCKSYGTMTYTQATASPSGWVYLCFVPAQGYAFDSFTTSSSDWTTGDVCLSICYIEGYDYVTVRYSLDLLLGDLGYRISSPVAVQEPAVEATSAPTATPQVNNVSSVVIVNSSVSVNTQSAAAQQPTAAPQPNVTPVPAAQVGDCVQDPIAFGEGALQFYSDTESAYCHRKNYQLTGGSAADFAKAYADACKNHPYMSYLGLTTSPSGWSYYCFASANGKAYDDFTNNSGDWSTGNLCLSISFKESSPYITICYSFDLTLSDLGCRISSPITTAVSQLDELKAIWLSDNQYYYNQLSAEHKQAFEDCISNTLNYPNQSPAAGSDYRRQALGPMIKKDNPRIFWVDWVDSNGRLRYETGDTAHMGAVQFPEGETLPSLQDKFLSGISTAVTQIKKNLPANASTRDTVKAIHDWLCENSSYNDSQTSSHKKESDPVAFAYLAAHSAYSAIIPSDAYEPVCEGYAGAFQVLCEEFGIEAICVYGNAQGIGNHTWNYVKLDDGQWYLVDVDADDLAASYNHTRFLLNEAQRAQYGYTPDAYLGSGVNPTNGYTEGAAFTFPELAK